MLVEVIEMRLTGMKLTRDELAEARRHRGNLAIAKGGMAVLHLGDDPALSHVLRPMSQSRIVRMRGDDFVLVGLQYQAYGRTTETCPQAWWCRNLRGDHLPPPGPIYMPRPVLSTSE